MKTIKDQLKIFLLFPYYLVKLFIYRRKTDYDNLPGNEFASYGFTIGRKLLLKGRFSPKLLLNPVSIVRYFEFDFANKNIKLTVGEKILDVSSTYLFGFYQAYNFTVDYNYINPDKRDLANMLSLMQRLKFKANYTVKEIDALNLPFTDNLFNTIISLSVIEHIKNDEDSKALKEMWRVLKPGGLLILTFPVKNKYEIEYHNKDEYNLNVEKKSNWYFFQRIYDEENINKRLLNSIDKYEIINKKVFGETSSDFYNGYKERWIKNGYSETVKDPYYISKHFRYFNNINDLKGIGVMGLTIKKTI